ncbi:MAG: FHA domain-containing protein [bacterium]|nr:FHA domain-containing protein [bacterium]
MRVILEIVSGPANGQQFQMVAPQVWTIGRKPDADLVFAEDRTMSGVHLRLDCQSESCELLDLHSTNGTFVNGERVQRHVLSDGDQVLAGQTTIRLRMQGESAQDTRPVFNDYSSMPSKVHLGAASATMPMAFERALNDDDARLRWAALHAAIWSRQPWLLAYCRDAVNALGTESLPALEILAILAEPSDLAIFSQVADETDWGIERFRILGIFGHPRLVPGLLSTMESAERQQAMAAAWAFAKITGWDSDIEVEIATGDNELTAEDTLQPEEEMQLPDIQAAQKHWDHLRQVHSAATRLCRGWDISRGFDNSILEQLDMQSRTELALRCKYHGAAGSLRELEAFPQGSSALQSP